MYGHVCVYASENCYVEDMKEGTVQSYLPARSQ